jgi:hypothetical protein
MGRSGQFRASSRGTFWPSEASAVNQIEGEAIGKCLRSVYYRLSGVKETNPPNAKSQVIFLLGRQVEESLVEIWKQAGIWENNSVRFEDRTHNVSGEFDCILREPTTQKKFGCELKSFRGYYQEKQIMGHSEGRGANKRWIFGIPKDENLMQAAIYADQTRGQLDGFKLFYVSRDNCDFAEFNVMVDDNGVIYVHDPKSEQTRVETRFTMHDIYSRYRSLAEHLSSGQIPPRDFTWKPSDEVVTKLFNEDKISKSAYEAHVEGKEKYTDWHCNYCSYQTHCHRET